MPEPELNDIENRTNDTVSSQPSTHRPLEMIGPLAMECAESVGDKFGDEARVVTVAVVVEIFAPDGHGSFIDTIEYASSEPRRWVQQAFLAEALAQAEARNENRVAEAEEVGQEGEEE